MKNKNIDVNKLVHRIKKLKSGREKKQADNIQRDTHAHKNPQLKVEDFMVYEETEFLDCAYKIILGRDPDSKGLKHYNSKLKSGSLTKLEILNELRFSLEGQMRGIDIKGLQPTPEQKEIENIYNDSSFDSQKGFYCLDNFLKYDDEEFILRSYQGILKRVPDQQGRQTHLSSLRNNEKSKEEILRELRYSEEGKARKVKIVDLLPKINKLEAIGQKNISPFKTEGETYHIEDLMALPEKSYVTKIFFLTRGYFPEDEEMDPILLSLWEKKKTRLDILKELQETSKGAFPPIKIKGLGIYRIRQRIKKIPILGIFGNYLILLATLPGFINRLQKKVNSSLVTHESKWESVHRENQHRQAKINELLDWHRLVNERLASLNSHHELDSLIKDQKKQLFLIKRMVSSKADSAELDRAFENLEELSKQMGSLGGKMDREAGKILALEEAVFPEIMIGKSIKHVYTDLHDRFRGPSVEIKKRFDIHLGEVIKSGLFQDKQEWILDIGCGRGEWLEVLKTHGVKAMGIDLIPDHVELCLKSGLEVYEAEALDHLKKMADHSIMGITTIQTIEHFRFPNLAELISQIFRVLKPGGLVMLETPNPENIKVGSYYFHLDPSHHKPLPALLIRFLLENTGFENCRIHYLNPGDHQLDSSSTSSPTQTASDSPLQTQAMDYLLIGHKP